MSDVLTVSTPDEIKAAEAQAKADMERDQVDVCALLGDEQVAAPFSYARRLAVAKVMEDNDNLSTYELIMVVAYILTLQIKQVWVKARNTKKLIEAALDYADECDPDEYESLVAIASRKMSHLEAAESVGVGGDDGEDDLGNV